MDFLLFLYLCFLFYTVSFEMKSFITFFLILISVVISANNSLPKAVFSESKVDSLCYIVSSHNVSYSKKIDIINKYSSLSMYSEYYNKLHPLYNNLLKEARASSDNDGLLFCYTSLATLSLGMWESEQAKKYIDSANVYVYQAINDYFIASYYGIRGRYIQRCFPGRAPEAIGDYQKSLSYYDKSGFKGKEDEIVIILRNLTTDAIQRGDSIFACKNIQKINELKKKCSSPVLDFSYMDVNVSLNRIYYQRTLDEKYLDSILVYSRKCLDLYESGLLPNSFNHLAIDLYSVTAETLSSKEGDAAVVDSILLIAESKYDLTDSIGSARIYQARALSFLDRDMIDSAEVYALKSQKYLEAKGNSNYYSQAKTNIEILGSVYFMKGDYIKAIEYYDLWTDKDDEIRANEIKKMELQYEFEEKEMELKLLKSNITYHDNLHKMYILSCVLLFLAMLFLALLIRSKRRSLNRHLALVDVDKEDAKLKLKLKEEQAIKVQLEKYEVLSDFYLKEIELAGKAKDLEQLHIDKEALDMQVELYHQKVEEYEVSIVKGEQMNYNIQNVILEDIKRLIMRQMPDRGMYVENVNMLNKSYVDTIREQCDGNLSVSHIKYCICFAIGMGIADVAECFNIEQSSVYMIRYRLKKRFRLGNDDDLGFFLQKQI